MDRPVPEATTRRLSLYLRVLGDLEALGAQTVSSREIADRCRLNPSQVRKDLAHFGGFGIRGVGYDVSRLRQVIAGILGLDRERRVIIVGAGNLGSALGDYPGFQGSGFEVVALFDVSADKIGSSTRSGRPVLPMGDLAQVIRDRDVDLAIVAVPAAAAQKVVDQLAAAGIRAILNFAPTRPTAPHNICIHHVDLKIELESLSYFLAGGDPGPLVGATVPGRTSKG